MAKSLVLIERTGETVRYRQLMTVREYGAERLARTGDLGRLKRRQRDHYRRRAAVMVDRWCGPGQADALRAMRRDHANPTRCSSGRRPRRRGPAGAELAALLRYHWIAGGHLADGRHWLQQLLTRLPTPGPERGNALWVAAWVALIQGDRDDAIAYLVECGEIADDLGDHRMSAHVAHWSALHHLFCGRTAAAAELYERAIAVHRGGGDTASVLLALFQVAVAQTYDGCPEQALQSCTDALELSDRYGERWNRAYSLWMTGLCRWAAGRAGARRPGRTRRAGAAAGVPGRDLHGADHRTPVMDCGDNERRPCRRAAGLRRNGGLDRARHDGGGLRSPHPRRRRPVRRAHRACPRRRARHAGHRGPRRDDHRRGDRARAGHDIAPIARPGSGGRDCPEHGANSRSPDS